MLETLMAKWAGLQPRERVLLGAMVLVVGLLATFMVTVVVGRSFDAKAAEIDQYREALYYLEDHQNDYVRDKAKKDALREKLADNDLQVASFLSQSATTLGFDVNVTPKDPRKAGGDMEQIEEQEFEITIKKVERDAFLEFLWAVSKTDEPIFIRRMNVRRSRARTTSDAGEAPLTGSMTVVSFRIND